MVGTQLAAVQDARMTLLNKFFSNRPKLVTKVQDNVCEKMFTQVRLVLFCECDFRGRKLLFDSHAVEKITLSEMPGKRLASSTGSMNTEISKNTKNYVEISHGHGYIYTKPNADIYQLGEMVFGSVAMSYRGTTYKIHHLNAPMRIMYTQVFPSTRHKHRFVRPRSTDKSTSRVRDTDVSNSNIFCEENTCAHNANAVSSSILEQSIRLLQEGQHNDNATNDGDDNVDSGTSSSFATSSCSHGESPVLSTASDTILFCRSNPLNISDTDYRHSASDSGVNNFFNSFGNTSTQSMPLNLNVANAYVTTFTNGSLYRRWLRSASTSLEHSSSSSAGSLSGNYLRSKMTTSNRSSKLGLAIIINLPVGQEEVLERFLMEHATLVEAMMLRARVTIEAAYRHRYDFVARLYNTAVRIARWLSDLITFGMLNNGCSHNDASTEHLAIYLSKTFGGLGIASVSRLWRTDWDLMRYRFGSDDGPNVNSIKKTSNTTSSAAEHYIRDLCELLESIDIKDTNFFVSTFVTAILTHHLGWVPTVLPVSTDEHCAFLKLRNSSNPLWGQLTDLYGAIGCPTKIARTIITGNSDHSNVTTADRSKKLINQTDAINKLLNSVTYFIRCSNIRRNCVTRGNIKAENQVANDICQLAGCILEKNYEKQVIHEAQKCEQKSNSKTYSALARAETTRSTLHKSTSGYNIKKSLSCLKSLDKIGENTCDINTSYSDLKNNIDNVFSNSRTNMNYDINNVFCETKQNDVVFVLGENDELIGLRSKKALTDNNDESTHPFKDSDFSYINHNVCIKKSQSQTDLSILEVASSSDAESRKKPTLPEYERAKSVPPGLPHKDHETCALEKTTPKYKYSGVKFNFQQYPQIVAHYMRSKNIELSNLQFLEKAQLAPSVFTAYDFAKYKVVDDFELDALQTPSNATDLEFSADQDDIVSAYKKSQTDTSDGSTCTDVIDNELKCDIEINGDSNVQMGVDEKREMTQKQSTTTVPCRIIKIVELPMPESIEMPSNSSYTSPIGFTHTLLQSTVCDHYVADLVLQGTSAPRAHWESTLLQDLTTTTQYSLLDQEVDEAIAIIANIDTWEVQLMSTATYVVDKRTSGIPIGMSQLVANMLESLLHLWKLQTPAEYCLIHIEQKLQEFCIRSKALAELLLATEFCSMDILTSALQLEVNDIPLLMSIASTHSPQIMQKYGLSFQ